MKVLIVVDMQNDFVTDALGTAEAVAIVPAVVERVREAQKTGERIFFTRDTHESVYLQTQEGQKLPVEHCLRGSKGWAVRSAQGALIAHGYSCGPDGTDGDLGYNTWNALLRFQGDRGLLRDGILGDETWTRLLLG